MVEYPKESCRNCKWYSDRLGNYHGGSCMRFPPQVIYHPDPDPQPGCYDRTRWPSVSGYDKCGEFIQLTVKGGES